jgi:hypothetical protein
MSIHMKTTIEISDPLLKSARQLAVRKKTMVKALMEEGWREVIAERAGGCALITAHPRGLGWLNLPDVFPDELGDVAGVGARGKDGGDARLF